MGALGVWEEGFCFDGYFCFGAQSNGCQRFLTFTSISHLYPLYLLFFFWFTFDFSGIFRLFPLSFLFLVNFRFSLMGYSCFTSIFHLFSLCLSQSLLLINFWFSLMGYSCCQLSSWYQWIFFSEVDFTNGFWIRNLSVLIFQFSRCIISIFLVSSTVDDCIFFKLQGWWISSKWVGMMSPFWHIA